MADDGYRTEQEQFWSGDFGDEYIGRNVGDSLVAGKTAMFAQILQRTRGVESVIELGANVGLNLQVLRHLRPTLERCTGVEINSKACAQMDAIDGVDSLHGSLLDIELDEGGWDLSFTAGVLIHIAPEALPRAYDQLYATSRRYIMVAEYFSPTPVAIPYRGHDDRLFKRDFCGDLLDRFSDLELVDYGFRYRRDPVFPGDDITWFLMEKSSPR